MVLALLQARMDSSRLPGKVMLEVLGKPLIGYLLERLSRSKKIDKIVLATSVNKNNDILCEYVQSQGYDIFRGSEEDVLSRYYEAAKKYRGETIVRITGDCVLIDHDICDQLIEWFFSSKADYAITSPKFAEGLDCEVFSFRILEIMNQAAQKKSEREHVTLFVRNRPEKFLVKIFEKEIDDSCYRIDVDEPEDFLVVKNIIKYFNGLRIDDYRFDEINKYLDEHPEVSKTNCHVIRNEGWLKSLQED